ncbi:MAG: acetyl-CoA carboxylase biotin carboxylase subunit [Acidobacteria bacterium]|nr:acetyl-CoA carboxylase biotin carboxylase subunit [Acidobacteriota bacterium]
MFNKVLVANRGEIALRVINACKELGIPTVAVYAEPDAQSLHVRFADEAVCIGPANPTSSYLNIPSVISAAEITRADAIHPGYGFLAENPSFADVCDACGITFIGPSPEIIRLSADKCKTRRRMESLGICILPGSDGAVETVEEAAEWAGRIGYPVLIKPLCGAGGFGMSAATSADELESAFETARRESQAAFGCDEVFVEKLIPNARHIEFQVLVDQHGSAISLGERECSIQRRHQKIVEESPSVALDAAKREEVGRAVERIMTEIGYTNLGSIEFLMDEQGCLYFLEMTSSIQLEHPVTEMVTGIDLVKSQILVATGAPLGDIICKPIKLRGHSIECCIHAENPTDFMPSSGKIQAFNVPGGTGVRADLACYYECVIQPGSDPLIAKLIVHGSNREEALQRMSRALEMFIIEGVQTSLPLHRRILADPAFRSGRYNENLLDRFCAKPSLVRQ